MIQRIEFPALHNTNEEGLLAMGGALSVDALVSAYSQGIFPWYNEGQPILWWSPDPRLVLYPEQLKVSRSLRKVIRQQRFELRANTAFADVMLGCAWRGQPESLGEAPATWITQAMFSAYLELHNVGYAHSIEVWEGKELFGGLYGVVLGNVFFGESMFSKRSNASKVALWALCQWLMHKGFKVIDCQVSNDHLLSLGAIEVPRTEFLTSLNNIDIQQANPNFAQGFSEFLSIKPNH